MSLLKINKAIASEIANKTLNYRIGVANVDAYRDWNHMAASMIREASIRLFHAAANHHFKKIESASTSHCLTYEFQAVVMHPRELEALIMNAAHMIAQEYGSEIRRGYPMVMGGL